MSASPTTLTSEPSLAAVPSRRWGPSARGLIGLLVAATIAFYIWTAQSPLTPFSIGPNQSGYYNLLVDGLLSGHLYMKVPADPRLATLKDPYDPGDSPEVPRIHDASYYKGRYYLYFGVAPAVGWFLPWRILTGRPISENLSVAIFCCAGFAIWTALFLRLIRRHFPGVGGGIAGWIVGLLGLGNMCAVMLRRPAFWEVPIAGAFLCNALCAWFLWLALVTPARIHRYLALASLALGFSIGSRPGGVFMAAGLGLLALWLARPVGAGQRWFSWRSLRYIPAAVGPVSLCVLLVVLYNYERFGSLTEFGTSYQVAGHNMHTWKMLDSANIPINIYFYFLSPPQLSVYFPFFQVIANPPFPAPKGYYGVENVYGVFPSLPIVLFGFASGAVAFSRRIRDAHALRIFTVALFVAFLGGLPVLLRYAASASRYMVDFVPWLVALAAIGILAGEVAFAGRRMPRLLFRLFWGAAATWTILFNIFVSFQHNELLRIHNPPVYTSLSRVFNRVSPVLEWFSGRDHGPLEIDLRLPKGRSGTLDPLVVTGVSFLADYVYLYYTDDRHVQIGFEHTGHGGQVSQPIVVDYDAVQHIRIELGSLYPPATHPYFAGQPVARVLDAKFRVKLWVNGVPYVDANSEFSESSPKNVVIGRDRLFGAFGRDFHGQILAVKRAVEPSGAGFRTGAGPVRMAVRFPKERIGQREPLVVTGVTGRGDICYINYIAPNRAVFAIDHWGFGEVKSAPVDVNFAEIHVLDIDLGSLHSAPPGPVSPAGFPAPYEIRVDGTVVLHGTTNFHPSTPDEIYRLMNPIGGSTTGPTFTGQIIVP